MVHMWVSSICFVVIVVVVVEYIGNIPAEKRDEILSQLNKEMERLIEVITHTYFCMEQIFALRKLFLLVWTRARVVSVSWLG